MEKRIVAAQTNQNRRGSTLRQKRLFAKMLEIYLEWAASVPEIVEAVDQDMETKTRV